MPARAARAAVRLRSGGTGDAGRSHGVLVGAGGQAGVVLAGRQGQRATGNEAKCERRGRRGGGAGGGGAAGGSGRGVGGGFFFSPLFGFLLFSLLFLSSFFVSRFFPSPLGGAAPPLPLPSLRGGRRGGGAAEGGGRAGGGWLSPLSFVMSCWSRGRTGAGVFSFFFFCSFFFFG